eukprot:GFUD01008147.1.p1 GENE.GFUD01008147.1~~GFUD01008147.1.p1  ORF type:complete len:456 (+),score=150.47 GFUD01008147.1:93-1460(+)
MSSTDPPPAMPGVSADPAHQPEEKWGPVVLTISNSVLPLEKLSPTPSSLDGMTQAVEDDLRNLGCNLIQTAGKLLKLPQVAMATGCVMFQRFFYSKSFVRYSMEVVAMGCVCLACKVEEAPRRARDVINVFHHIKQVRQGKPIKPVILDTEYISLKNNIIKAERRVLKELGFCVHIKHPHKLIVMYMQLLGYEQHDKFVQMSWNFMNDSLRTDGFVRYQPETIACACIYLSARKLGIPLPKKPSWYEILNVEEDDIRDCCYRIICLYQRSKPVQEELEKVVDSLKAALDETRKQARQEVASSVAGVDSPASQPGSPERQGAKTGGEVVERRRGSEGERSRSRSQDRGQSRKRKKHKRERSHSGSDRDKKDKREKKGKRERSWSHSPISKGRKGGGGRSRSRDRQYSSHRTGQYLSHERFDKGDSRVAWDKDRRDKYDHRGYQEKYKKGERDHYRR